MSMLHVYRGPDLADEITDASPDTVTGSGTTGFTDEQRFWLVNDDPTRTYKTAQGIPAIRITAQGDDASVTVTYAPDVSGAPGTYTAALNLPDGPYTTPVPFWRRVVVAGGQAEQVRVDIFHLIEANRFVA